MSAFLADTALASSKAATGAGSAMETGRTGGGGGDEEPELPNTAALFMQINDGINRGFDAMESVVPPPEVFTDGADRFAMELGNGTAIGIQAAQDFASTFSLVIDQLGQGLVTVSAELAVALSPEAAPEQEFAELFIEIIDGLPDYIRQATQEIDPVQRDDESPNVNEFDPTGYPISSAEKVGEFLTSNAQAF